MVAVLACAAAAALVGVDSWDRLNSRAGFVAICLLGLAAAAALAVHAQMAARRGHMLRAQFALLLAYCALLAGPASQLYRQVDAWQNLPSIGRAIAADAAGRPLILWAPDETTRALIDMYARTSVRARCRAARSRLDRALEREAWPATRKRWWWCSCPAGASPRHSAASRRSSGSALEQSRDTAPDPPAWASAIGLQVDRVYALPNGRRYALLESRR